MSSLIGFRKLVVSLAIFAFVSLASIASVNANPVVYQLTQGNPGLQACAGCTGPYANVTVNRTSSTTATITFQGLTQGTNIYLFGGAGAIGLNFNLGATGVVGVTSSSIPFDGTHLQTPGSGNEDGFGSFNFTIDNFDGFTNAFSTLTFDVSCPLCNWAADGSDVLTVNSDGNSAAAHIYVSCATCGGTGGTGARATGYASDGTPSTETPEPATMLLLGTGLVGLGATARRRLRRKKE